MLILNSNEWQKQNFETAAQRIGFESKIRILNQVTVRFTSIIGIYGCQKQLINNL